MVERKICFPSASYSSKCPWFIDCNTGIWGKNENGVSKLYGCEGLNEKGLSIYSDICICEDCLIFVPGWQDEERPIIKKFNLTTREENFLRLSQKCRRDVFGNSLFSKGVVKDEYVYMFGCSYPSVVRLNINTNKIDYIEEWHQSLTEINPEQLANGFFNLRQVSINNDYIYAACSCATKILKINTETLEEEFITIECGIDSFFNIVRVEENTYAIGYNRGIVIWNEDKGTISVREYESFENYLPIKILPIGTRKLIVFPARAYKAEIIVDNYALGVDDIKRIPINHVEKGTKPFWSDIVVYAEKMDADSIVYVSGDDLSWHKINILTCQQSDFFVLYDDCDSNYIKVMRDYFKAVKEIKTPFSEKEIRLNSFVDDIICN